MLYINTIIHFLHLIRSIIKFRKRKLSYRLKLLSTFAVLVFACTRP